MEAIAFICYAIILNTFLWIIFVSKNTDYFH